MELGSIPEILGLEVAVVRGSIDLLFRFLDENHSSFRARLLASA
jgi:hypothetical protein